MHNKIQLDRMSEQVCHSTSTVPMQVSLSTWVVDCVTMRLLWCRLPWFIYCHSLCMMMKMTGLRQNIAWAMSSPQHLLDVGRSGRRRIFHWCFCFDLLLGGLHFEHFHPIFFLQQTCLILLIGWLIESFNIEGYLIYGRDVQPMISNSCKIES